MSLGINMNSRYQSSKVLICSLKKNMASQTQKLSIKHQALFASTAALQLQVDNLLYLYNLCSGHKEETPLDTKLKADSEADADEVVPSISSSNNQEDNSRKHLGVW